MKGGEHMSDFYSATKQKARKPNRCDWCRKIIDIGESYIKVFGKWQGEIGNRKECIQCNNLISVMSQDKDYKDYIYNDGFDEDTLEEFHKEKICPTCKNFKCEAGMNLRVRCDNFEFKGG